VHHLLLRCLHSAIGEDKISKKLLVGFDSFKLLNQPKTDVNLRFSTQNTQVRQQSLVNAACC